LSQPLHWRELIATFYLTIKWDVDNVFTVSALYRSSTPPLRKE